MTSEHEYSVVVTTTDSETEAESLAKALVANKLAACVQLTHIVSHYVWEGETTKSDEILMLIKTKRSKVNAIKEYIDKNHSYDTPELIELPVLSGLPGYLHWIDEVTT